MKDLYQNQIKFVRLLKALMPSNVNLARDLMDLLEISQDAVYRRLRCETALTLDETVKICLHYSIPLEALNNEVQDVVTFQFHPLSNSLEAFRDYLVKLGGHLKSFRKHEPAHIHYAAEDIPLFYHFAYKELAEFKTMYWLKSILNIPELEMVHFPNPGNPIIGEAEIQLMYSNYSETPTTEIWTDATVDSSLKQIQFYWDAGFFVDAAAAHQVLEQMKLLVNRVSRQAETGQKLDINGASTGA
ncbi:MAG: hypothetical protein KDC13_09630, partial [Bacteroidetes bacterium]|nr:hypothetical protein [Bacteroidota bacterium]